MQRFVDSSYSLTNSAQESTFAHFKYVKNENPNMKSENLEALTLWRNNNLQKWLTAKPDSERQQLITQARALTNSIKTLHAQNATKTKTELRNEYQKIDEDKTKDDRSSIRYCNLISSDRKSFVPFSKDQLDDKRKTFNSEIGVDGKNKVWYLIAFVNT